MDYAIYKTNDGKNPRVIHRFTQEACSHRAKRAAVLKLHEMWLRVINRPDYFKNYNGNNYEFPTTIRQAQIHQSAYAST